MTIRDHMNLIEGLNELHLPLRKGTLGNARGNYGAFIVVMDPHDFILLSTPAKEVSQIYKDKFTTVDSYKRAKHPDFNKNNYNMPFLGVRYDTGKVFEHEGCHRAAMVAKEGGTKFPCYVMFRSPTIWTVKFVKTDSETYDSERLEQDFNSKNEADLFIHELRQPHEDYWYSDIDLDSRSSRMKGSPRSNPEKWEYDAWNKEDMPQAFIGQFDPISIPTSKMKFAPIKGYHHYT